MKYIVLSICLVLLLLPFVYAQTWEPVSDKFFVNPYIPDVERRFTAHVCIDEDETSENGGIDTNVASSATIFVKDESGNPTNKVAQNSETYYNTDTRESDRCLDFTTHMEHVCRTDGDTVYIERGYIPCADGQVCRDGACTSQRSEAPEEDMVCQDTDDGKNYFVKGTTTGIESSYGVQSSVDVCGEWDTQNTLKEFYCNGQVQNMGMSRVYINCPDGCQDGACIQEDSGSQPSKIISTCADSDDGENQFVKGYTTGIYDFGLEYEFKDFCLGSLLEESLCSRTQPTSKSIICPNGCEDGGCLQEKSRETGYVSPTNPWSVESTEPQPALSCSILSGGNPGVLTQVAVQSIEGEENTLTSECEENKLNFFDCTETEEGQPVAVWNVLTCQNGCSDGACIHNPPQGIETTVGSSSPEESSQVSQESTVQPFGGGSWLDTILRFFFNLLFGGGFLSNTAPTDAQICTDSDGGKAYDIYGKVVVDTWNTWGNFPSTASWSDTCVYKGESKDPNYLPSPNDRRDPNGFIAPEEARIDYTKFNLLEYFCNDKKKGKVDYEEKECSSGICLNGKCISDFEDEKVFEPVSEFVIYQPVSNFIQGEIGEGSVVECSEILDNGDDPLTPASIHLTVKEGDEAVTVGRVAQDKCEENKLTEYWCALDNGEKSIAYTTYTCKRGCVSEQRGASYETYLVGSCAI